MPADDEDLDALLDRYLDPPAPEQNPDYADVDIEIDEHILEKIESKHALTETDVRDAILGAPPAVEESAHLEPEKRVFRGVTRHGREVFIVGVWVRSPHPDRRRLRIATAFIPDDDDYGR
jgi:hypothetical protein